jgi:hypothetical protein
MGDNYDYYSDKLEDKLCGLVGLFTDECRKTLFRCHTVNVMPTMTSTTQLAKPSTKISHTTPTTEQGNLQEKVQLYRHLCRHYVC